LSTSSSTGSPVVDAPDAASCGQPPPPRCDRPMRPGLPQRSPGPSIRRPRKPAHGGTDPMPTLLWNGGFSAAGHGAGVAGAARTGEGIEGDDEDGTARSITAGAVVDHRGDAGHVGAVRAAATVRAATCADRRTRHSARE
jgi:hypothetical protein